MNLAARCTGAGLVAAALFLFARPSPHVAHAEPAAPAFAGAQAQSVDLGKLFDAVVETTERRFYDDERLARLNWRSRADAVRPSVLAAPTAADAVKRINALLGELGVSHTALYTPDDYEYAILLDIVGPGRDSGDFLARTFWGSEPYYPGIGVFTKLVDGRHFVDGVMEGSPAALAGVEYGDEILSVDGAPYGPIAAFRGRIGETVELAIRRTPDAEPLRLKAPVIAITPGRAFTMATKASARVIESNGKRIGYVHVWGAHDPSGLRAALDSLPKQPALDARIIDMRGRVGGSMEVAGEYLSILTGGANPYWGDATFFSRSGKKDSADPFPGRTALLIDEHTRSAAEIMAYGFKRSGLGPVIGAPSAGAVTSGQTFIMPGDFLLYLAGSRIEFDGKSLEGVGITPNHFVERPLPYANGADPVLDAATALLTESAG